MWNYLKDNYYLIFSFASAIWAGILECRIYIRNKKQDKINSKIYEKELKSQIVFNRIDRTSFYVLYQIKNIGGSVAENIEIENSDKDFTIDKDCSAKFPIKRLSPNNEPYLLKINIKSGVNSSIIKYKWVDKYYGIQEDEFEISTIGY